jgi:Predicted transcriptional regulator
VKASEVTLDWLLPQLEGVEGSGNSYQAWCPVHDDEGSQHKGLSITLSGNRVLCKCQSPQCGATLTQVIAVLTGEEDRPAPKVTVRAQASTQKERGSKKRGFEWWVSKTLVPIEVWEALGVSQNGTGVIFEFNDPPVAKIRKPPKEIIWTGMDEWGAPPLWPTPEGDLPSHISIWEGESDCGTARFCGLPQAYAATKGAQADFPPGMFEELRSRGVSEITVGGDADSAGIEFSIRASGQALAAGLRVNVVHIQDLVSAFSGVNDLNGVLRLCDGDPKECRAQIEKVTRPVANNYPVLDMDEIDEIAETEMNWILPGMISPGDKVLISGPQKSYKTYIELDLARSLVSCTAFLNRPEWVPNHPVNVLLIQEEGSKQAWAKRIRRLSLQGTARARFHTLHRRGIRFTEPDTIDFVLSYCREHEIHVVMFDPLQRMMPGIDENDNAATGIVWDQVMRMQFALPDLVCVVVHHANKSETLTWESVRGASRHGGEVDLGLFVQKTDDGVRIGVDGRDIPRYLGTGEAFDATVSISADDEAPNLFIDATEIHVKVNQVQNLVLKNRDAVMNAVADGCTTLASVVSQTGIADNTARKYLKELVEEGHVEETQQGPGKANTYAAKGERTGTVEEGDTEG